MSPRFSKENFGKNMELVEKLKEIASKKGCTPSQLSLAWLLAQGEDVPPPQSPCIPLTVGYSDSGNDECEET